MKKLIITLLLLCAPAFAQTYTVARVIDGDTLELTSGEIVRLLGIDCPENEYSEAEAAYLNRGKKWERGPGEEEQAKQATEFVATLVKPGQEVRLEFDVEKRDRYKRLFAYVYIPVHLVNGVPGHENGNPISFSPLQIAQSFSDGNPKAIVPESLNAYIIESGYASPMTMVRHDWPAADLAHHNVPPNVKYADLFQKLYEEAREQKRGFWSEPADLELPDYDVLARACKGSGCCLTSVKRMKEGGYLLAPGKTLAESGCPEGTKPDMLKCIDSYRWCVPE